jgi:hypothetical protein
VIGRDTITHMHGLVYLMVKQTDGTNIFQLRLDCKIKEKAIYVIIMYLMISYPYTLINLHMHHESITI